MLLMMGAPDEILGFAYVETRAKERQGTGQQKPKEV